MKIEASSVQLAASHEFESRYVSETHTQLEFRSVLSEVAADESTRRAEEHERIARMLQSLVEEIVAALEGKSGKACGIEALEGSPPVDSPAGPTRRLSWTSSSEQHYSEREQTRVCARGEVKTADGRCIAFDFRLDMARSFERHQKLNTSGEIELKDPLVINFSGSAAALDEVRIDFDLDADGQPEQIPGIGQGNGFLVFDRNDNGRADDGSELFGALSGNGFADLASLDADGNGWVDEGDPDFSRLHVWQGADFGTLAQHGIGALGTAAVNAPFSLKTSQNELLGEIRAVGIYLRESGEVGSLQQLDLVTTPAVSAPTGEQPDQRQDLAA